MAISQLLAESEPDLTEMKETEAIGFVDVKAWGKR